MVPATEPPDDERQCVVVVVGINTKAAADLTFPTLQFSTAECGCDGAVSPKLVAVTRVPLVLSPPFFPDDIRGVDLGGGVHQRTSG